jgi:hypothetical protein
VEKKGVIMAGLVVFPILSVLFNFQFERQMDQVVKTAAAEVTIVENDSYNTYDGYARDVVVYHVTKEAKEKLYGYSARFVGYDYDRNVIKVRIYGLLSSGSDMGCERAAILFHSLTNNLVDAQIEVTGDWIPSKRKLMDRNWTQHLVNRIEEY